MVVTVLQVDGDLDIYFVYVYASVCWVPLVYVTCEFFGTTFSLVTYALGSVRRQRI